jgi:hypothetical protein
LTLLDVTSTSSRVASRLSENHHRASTTPALRMIANRPAAIAWDRLSISPAPPAGQRGLAALAVEETFDEWVLHAHDLFEGPKASIRPSDSTATRVASAARVSRSWVTRMTVSPSACAAPG